jgi:sugar phosphate isomerase/epimerase
MSIVTGIKIPGGNLEKGSVDIARYLQLIQETGYQAVEFSPDSFDLIACGVVNRDLLKELAALLAGFALKPVLHVPLRLNLFNREYPQIHRDVLEASCEIAESLGSGVLVYHPGRSVDNVEFLRLGKPDDAITFSPVLLDYEARVLREVAQKYPSVTIAMENHRPYQDHSPYSYAEYCTNLADQIAAIDCPNVKGCIDTGHLNLSAAYHKRDIREELVALRPHLVHCHIHDNHGITNYYTDKDKQGMLPFGVGDEHIVPGQGTFPFDTFFPVMQGFSGIYMVELTGRAFYASQIRAAMQQVKALHAASASADRRKGGSVCTQ